MNIDLLPFSAFLLECSGVAAPASPGGHTLTLPLGLVPVHAAFETAMSGTVTIQGTALSASLPQRAAVVPAGGAALTITF